MTHPRKARKSRSCELFAVVGVLKLLFWSLDPWFGVRPEAAICPTHLCLANEGQYLDLIKTARVMPETENAAESSD